MKHKISDERLDRIIGTILTFGVALAATLVLIGGSYYLIRHGKEIPRYQTFHGQPAQLRTISGIVTFAMQSHSRGIIELGLLFLIATPIARVVFSIIAFAQQRDRFYVIITCFVLSVLLYNLIVGYR